MAGGIYGTNPDAYLLWDDSMNKPVSSVIKPPYRVPTMKQIAKLPRNGFKVISTFSGCGGSCLGFEMAGYEILWASEFIDAARQTYKANHPKVPVDGSDIRQIKPEDVLKLLKIRQGEIDVLEGSPPCAAFSSSGSREEKWGKVVPYSNKKQRVDDLFFEYTRMVDGLRPRVFVAENVSGLIRGVAKGYFKEIIRTMKKLGYNVEARLLDAQWLGVPQQRSRIIFVGVRDDLGGAPAFPKPYSVRYSIRDAFEGLPGPKEGSSDGKYKPLDPETDYSLSFEKNALFEEWRKLKRGEISDKYLNLVRSKDSAPSFAVTASGNRAGIAGVAHSTEPRKFTLAEVRRICSFPDDFQLTGTYMQRWERMGRAVPPLMMRAIASTVLDEILIPLRKAGKI